MNESTPWKKITRTDLYEKFPYLQNLSLKEMIDLIVLCFQTKSDEDLIYYIKCYMHSYPELQKSDNFTKIFKIADG
jgi:hypothetical protein